MFDNKGKDKFGSRLNYLGYWSTIILVGCFFKIATASSSKVSHIVDKFSSFTSIENTTLFKWYKFFLVSTKYWEKDWNLEFSSKVTTVLKEKFRQVVNGENFSKELVVGFWLYNIFDVRKITEFAYMCLWWVMI